MRKILVIDNYDSFTYNLVHYLEKLTNEPVVVYRNDEITLDKIDNYDKIVLSPGPGIPVEAGICIDLIKEYAATKSILGVCLGHQALAEAFGAGLLNLDKVYHGVSSEISVLTPDDPLYIGLPDRLEVGRYHSWIVSRDNIPDCLTVTCEDEQGLIMGVSHKEYDLKGVQYHPESVLTEHGLKIIDNWLKL